MILIMTIFLVIKLCQEPMTPGYVNVYLTFKVIQQLQVCVFTGKTLNIDFTALNAQAAREAVDNTNTGKEIYV